MTRRARRRLSVLSLIGFLFVVSACMFLPNFPKQYKSGKYEPAEEAQQPRAVAGTPVVEVQTEGHTCGWHAVRSLYVAYGLDPGRHRLRFRLGTDEPAMRADKDSTGTLHPDLYRVLAQDGFYALPIDLGRDDAAEELAEHLGAGQLALVVVYRSTYHWVLVGPGGEGEEAVVYDSLVDRPVGVGIDELVGDSLSITRVWPAPAGSGVSSTTAHTAGVSEMARLYQRKE